ncbi:MAG: hypothetical protein ABEL51_08565, partial [Salinibacter sp.]
MSGSERRIAQDPNRREFLASMGVAGVGSLLVGCRHQAGPGGESPNPSVPDPRGFGEIEVPEEIAPIDAPFRIPDLSRPTFPDR